MMNALFFLFNSFVFTVTVCILVHFYLVSGFDKNGNRRLHGFYPTSLSPLPITAENQGPNVSSYVAFIRMPSPPEEFLPSSFLPPISPSVSVPISFPIPLPVPFFPSRRTSIPRPRPITFSITTSSEAATSTTYGASISIPVSSSATWLRGVISRPP